MKKLAVFAVSILLTFSAYADTKFVNLLEDQPIRTNNGEIKVTIRSDLPFNFYVDDDLVVSTSTIKDTITFTLANVDRGTHTLRVESAAYSDEVTIHVLRAHK